MLKHITTIKQVMDTYNKITKNGSLCYDTKLNLVATVPETLNIQEFSILGFGKLLSFLAETFAQTGNKDKYFACFLKSNLVCHIIFLSVDNRYICAIITEPVLLKTMPQHGVEDISSIGSPPSEVKKLERLLSKKKIVPYEQAMVFGTVLNSLGQSHIEKSFVQELKSFEEIISQDRIALENQRKLNSTGIERHTPEEVYKRIKYAIQEGDINAITDILNEQSASNAPMHQLHKTDYLRSIKNSFIKLCSMACYAAIDAGAPYVQTLDMADNLIVHMESLKNITDLYEQMKIVLNEFTKAVFRSKKTGFSQPVRKSMDYLYNHYNEKVTLKDLSNHTNFSFSYLSNLIKLETGLSLNDNLNKIRIEQSQKLLLESNGSILDIAQNVGFHYQNHFASIFKKYTGISPSEYRNIQKIERAHMGEVAETSDGDTIEIAMQQLKTRLNLFNGLFDMARIVDPVEHNSWIVFGDVVSSEHQVCYDFWNNNEVCQNCISIRAYVQNDTIFKLEQKGNSTFLALAFPLKVGKTTYIAELITNITMQSIIIVNDRKEGNINDEANKDLRKGLYTRHQLDKMLPTDIRRAKAEQRKMSLLAVAHSPVVITEDNYEASSSINDILAETSIPCLPLPEDWIGCYTGNLLLYVLHDCSSNRAKKLFKCIQDKFIDKSHKLGVKTVTLNYAVQEMDQDISETGELLYLLLAKLNNEELIE